MLAWVPLVGQKLVEVSLKASVVFVTLAFAASLLLGRRRRPAHWFLIGFLLLIAMNASFEFLLSLSPPVGWREPLARWALVAAALDPLVLYYFAAVHPERTRASHPMFVVPLAGLAVAFMFVANLFHGQSTAPGAPAVAYLLWQVYTFSVYCAVAVLFLRGTRNWESYRGRSLLLTAMAIVIMPLPARIIRSTRIAFGEVVTGPFVDFDATLTTAYLAVLAGGTVLLRGLQRRGASGQYIVPALAGFGMTLVLTQHFVVTTAARLAGYGILEPTQVVNLAPIGAALRWILFSYLASIAIVRYDLLGLDGQAKYRCARIFALVTAALVSLGAFVVVPILTTGRKVSLDAPVAWLVAFALLATQFVRPILHRIGHAVYDVPHPTDSGAALEQYHSAARMVLREGGRPEHSSLLKNLQRELSLRDQTAKVLQRMASHGGPIRLEPGDLLGGRYRVDHEIATGGQYRVLLAFDELEGQQVVVKEALAGPHDPVANANREVRAIQRVRSAGVVPVLDVFDEGHRMVIVMAYMDGGTLSERITTGELFSAGEVQSIAFRLLDTLAEVHAVGILHRDIKPSNILLDGAGRPYLADFGIALLHADQTADIEGLSDDWGTRAFMAPELGAGKTASPRTDLWALATTLLRIAGDNLDSGTRGVLKKARHTDPEQRYRSAGAMRRALERVHSSTDDAMGNERQGLSAQLPEDPRSEA